MKRKTGREVKILGLSILIMLVFLFSFNITYSYFTASKSAKANGNMAKLDVSIGYNINNIATVTGSNIVVKPTSSASISRGDTFNLALSDGTAIQSVRIVSTASVKSYVRLWVDAYMVNGSTLDTSTNYGKYFELQVDTNDYKKENFSDGSNVVYYYKTEYSEGSNTFVASSIKLLESAPNVMLNANMAITIRLDSVQASHGAFKSEFDDVKGWYSGWNENYVEGVS